MTTATVPPGTDVGPFVVETLIGRGGMGEVYRATHRRLGRPVALKLLSPALAVQETFVTRFLREARVMQSLEHPGIATVYDAGEADGRLYLAMRHVPGATLKEHLAEGRYEPRRALALLAALAEALDYAHARGVIHRDIKPSNVLIDEQGRPVLVDFGLAKALDDASVTVSSQYLGTPRYMAPEQAAGEPVGHRADLYALGCLAFEVLTGTPPFMQDSSMALLLAHGRDAVPRASEREPSLPPSVDAVFTRALAKIPTQRHPSAGALVEDLTEALAGQDGPRRGRRKRLRLLVTAAVVLTAVVGGVALALGPPPPADSGQAERASAPADVARGELVYRAAFDAEGSSFVDTVGRGTEPSDGVVRFLPDRMELAALAPQANVGTDLRMPQGVTTYVGDLDLSVTPGSDALFCWGLRWAVQGKLAYELCVDTLAEFVQLDVWNGENKVPITPRIDVPGLQTGRPVTLTVVVLENRLGLWVDGEAVADVEDDQVPPSATIPGLDVYSRQAGGTVTVHGLSLYELSGN
ncbi:MAG TPA: serine/threonine-protein kinase [Geodermatophilus sp.]|nr:serine/threonine-protein kinase [Geodermatophilus sp.]